MIGAIIAKRKARGSLQHLNRGDVQAFLEDWADDAVFIYPGNLPISGTIKGKPAIDDWFRRFVNQYPGTCLS